MIQENLLVWVLFEKWMVQHRVPYVVFDGSLDKE